MAYDIPPDRLDKDLLLEFFWKFSVFECALKREGFLSAGPNNSAQPDWHRFAASIEGRFAELECQEFRAAVEELKAHSPRRQVVRDGKLAWRETQRHPDESDERFVVRLLKTTRNNLFHGGKYPDGQIDEIAANKAVLKAGLNVLKGCYELHPGIAAHAEEAA